MMTMLFGDLLSQNMTLPPARLGDRRRSTGFSSPALAPLQLCNCVCNHVSLRENSFNYRHEIFRLDGQRLWHYTIKFTRWQLLIVGRGAIAFRCACHHL